MLHACCLTAGLSSVLWFWLYVYKASGFLDPFQSWLPHPFPLQKPFCFLQPSSHVTSSRKPSSLQSIHLGERPKKEKTQPTNTSIVWSASLNTVEYLFSQAWRTPLSFGGSKQPYTSSPLLSGEIGIHHSGRQGWARLVQKGNGLTLAGVFQDGKINCSSCCFQQEGSASHSHIALSPFPKGQKLWEWKIKRLNRKSCGLQGTARQAARGMYGRALPPVSVAQQEQS